MATATQTANLTGILGGLAFGFRDANGFPSNGSNSLITGVTKAFKDTVTAPSGTYAVLLTVSATVANASLVSLKKVLLINKSATITARVGRIDASAKASYVELGPKSAVFYDTSGIDTQTDGSLPTSITFTAIDNISAAGVSGTADIAVLACGT